MPSLALFGFSPYLENLVMNAKETDRKTRSGGRGIRPVVERAPTRVKRKTEKAKNKDSDPDGPDEEAKTELYRLLCVISYQLQADLDMVPTTSSDQLDERYDTPSRENHLAPAGSASAVPSVDASRAATPAVNLQKQVQASAPEPIIKLEQPQSPPLSHQPRPNFSPESSPEVALMDSIRPSFQPTSYQQPYPSYAHDNTYHQPRHSPDPYSWHRPKLDSPPDEPMSPVHRPARSNIMSISALMSGPSPSKARSPTPELVRTPPAPAFMQHWTEDDEYLSQLLGTWAASVPKLDTTELDRLTQIAQLAAFDLPLPSSPTTPEISAMKLQQSEAERRQASAKFDPQNLDPLSTLDTAALYASEEAEYLDEKEASDEVYDAVPYLSSFDEVVDEWRAAELSRLRFQLEMRKAEIGRIWDCDRKLAWSTFLDARAGGLYRKARAEIRRREWQAEMELDLLQVHRRKTRGVRKLTKDIFVPDIESLNEKQSVDLYHRFGRFLSAAKHSKADEPLVRADLRKIKEAVREQKQAEAQAKRVEDQAQATADATDGVEAVIVDAGSIASLDDFDTGGEYDSDSSYASSSSGISSLPSFSSVYSSPRLPSIIADDELETILSDVDAAVSETATLRDADSDSDEDAEESLWARQMRLANQTAPEHVSGLQPPAVPSRATTPAVEGRGRKRKRKKPPPPGARLWKKGRVQQDPEPEAQPTVVQQETQQQKGKVEYEPPLDQAYGAYAVENEMHPPPQPGFEYGYGTRPSYQHDLYSRGPTSNHEYGYGYAAPPYGMVGGDVEMHEAGRYTPPLPPLHQGLMAPHHYPQQQLPPPLPHQQYPQHPPYSHPPPSQWPYQNPHHTQH